MAQPLTPTYSISKHTNVMTTKPSPSSIFLFFLTLCILGLYTFFNTHHHSSSISSDSINHLRFRNMFLSSATNSTIASYLRALTLHPHLAGTDLGLQTARYVQSQFEDLGLNTHTTSYDALLSYPVHASLSAHFSNGSVSEMGLTEPGFAGGSEVVQPYHAYSPSGSAYAKVVFANYGKEEDYRALLMLGVNVSGCVVIVRRGEYSRGGVVEKAAEKGAAAVLMYAEIGKVKEGGVERGTVLLKGVGDPVSPGWAGVEGGESLSLENLEVSKRFPKIPSLPISTQNAYIGVS